jgi:hypothetical protein
MLVRMWPGSIEKMQFLLAMYKSAVEVKDAVKRWSTLTLQRVQGSEEFSTYI